MIRRFQGRIHFAHLRDVWIVGPQEFIEVAHGSGCLPLPQVMSTLIETGFSGPIRPDHGRNILGENVPRPGYGMYDRAMGLRYLQGLHAGLCAAADRSRNEPTKPYQEGANQ